MFKPKHYDQDLVFQAGLLDYTPKGLADADDFIYGYSGDKGKRTTDVSEIMAGITSGKIKTSGDKILAELSSFSRAKGNGTFKTHISQVDSFRRASLIRYANPGATKWGDSELADVSQFPNFDVDPRSGEQRVDSQTHDSLSSQHKIKGLAQYISAVNTELNMKDDEEEIESLNAKTQQLSMNTKRDDELNQRGSTTSFRRRKLAMRGLLPSGFQAITYYGSGNSIYVVDPNTGTKHYAPPPSPPTA